MYKEASANKVEVAYPSIRRWKNCLAHSWEKVKIENIGESKLSGVTVFCSKAK